MSNDKITEAYAEALESADVIPMTSEELFRLGYQAALQQPESEPVEWCREQGHRNHYLKTGEQCTCQDKFVSKIPLYAGPPPSAQVPEGYVLMPEELTREMWAAAGDAVVFLQVDGIGHHDKIVGTVWEKIKQAAPSIAERAPEDNGIPELDSLCARYNAGEIDLTQLVCSAWNMSSLPSIAEKREEDAPEDCELCEGSGDDTGLGTQCPECGGTGEQVPEKRWISMADQEPGNDSVVWTRWDGIPDTEGRAPVTGEAAKSLIPFVRNLQWLDTGLQRPEPPEPQP